MKNYTASATLSDKTIISMIANVDDNNINLAVTILGKGFYVATKRYSKNFEKPELLNNMHIVKIMQDEVDSIANSSDYKITFNF